MSWGECATGHSGLGKEDLPWLGEYCAINRGRDPDNLWAQASEGSMPGAK